MSRREAARLATELTELEFYRFKRYETPFSLAILCFESALPEGLEEALRRFVRRTDLIEELTHCSLLVIFGHTSRAEAALAMRHLDQEISKHGAAYHLGLTTAQNEDKTVQDVIDRAIDEMDDAARCLEC